MKLIISYIIIILVSCNSSNETEQAEPVLVSNLKFEEKVTDIWYYKDASDSVDYALVGYGQEGASDQHSGVYIVSLEDIDQPKLTKRIEYIGGWDIKTWGTNLYTVSGNTQTDGKIISIKDPANPLILGSFPGGHNITISSDGILIVSQPGIRIYDIKTDSDKAILLTEIGSLQGHEAYTQNNHLYDFHGFDGTHIYDLSDPNQPLLLSTIKSDLIRYHHSGWTNEDETILIITDERPAGNAETGDDFTVWNIEDKTNPILISKYKDLDSTIHNVQIKMGKAYFSYYVAGFKVFDLMNPSLPKLIYNYDTTPSLSGKGFFLGAFGVYVMPDKPFVLISDVEHGLFIFNYSAFN